MFPDFVFFTWNKDFFFFFFAIFVVSVEANREECCLLRTTLRVFYCVGVKLFLNSYIVKTGRRKCRDGI